MNIRAAELFLADNLAGRGFNEGRSPEINCALVLDDDRLVGHRWNVRATRCTKAHDHGNLRYALRRHIRLVEENASEMLTVGEDIFLLGKEGSAGIDKVKTWKVIL